MRVTVAHPRCVRRFAGTGLHWIYADERLGIYERVATILGEDRRLIPAEAFQDMAAQLQPEFVEWTDAHIRHSDVADALLTPLHRNPFGNNLLLHLTWLTLMARDGDFPDELLVLSESSAFARTVDALCRTRGWSCQRHGRLLMAIVWWKTRLRASIKLGYELLTALARMAMARIVLGRAHLARCRLAELLIDAYFYEGSLAPDGRFHDKHLPGLVDWYQAQGLRPAVYPFLIHVPFSRLATIYARMRDSATLFVPWERFVRPGQAFSAAWRCLAYGLCSHRRLSDFRGVAATRLVSSLRFHAATAGLYPMLLAQAPASLRKAGIAPKYFLDWFENQPIDKANAIGFAADQPDCRVIGVRQYALYPNFANLYTTDREVAARACPNECWVSGKTFIPMLRRYDKSSAYRTVPALRYTGLYAVRREDCPHSDLLVVLTHSSEESLAILSTVFPVLERVAGHFGAVRIKAHSDYPVARFIGWIAQRWPWASTVSWLDWETRPMDDLLDDARVVVTAGTSAALEALCRGVPVAMVGRRAGLDMNPLAGADPRLWTVVYDAASLERTVSSWGRAYPLPAAEMAAAGSVLCANFFEPPGEAAWQAFLP